MPGEPKALAEIFANVKGLGDELIVVCDDPPSDAFRETAKHAGAKLAPHRWNDDFSAARNAGLSAAAGEWVFWIDSDERLISPDIAAFRKLLEPPDVLGYYVSIEDISGEQSAMTPRWHRSLYRRRPEIRYSGRIHEHFQPSLEALAEQWRMKLKRSGARLQHSGYRPGLRKEKLLRNIRLLELELSDRPGQIYYLIELGRSLLLAGEGRGHEILGDAARAVIARQSESQAPIGLVSALLEYALLHARPDFALSPALAIQLAQRWFPRNAPLVFSAARWYYQSNDIAVATELLARLLEMGETGDFDDTVSFDRRIFGHDTRINYGVCLAKLGQRDHAVEQFKRVPGDSPFFSMAKANIERLS